MKLITICFLTLLVTVGAFECGEEKEQACMKHFFDVILRYTTDEEICRGISMSLYCLRETVDRCVVDEDVKNGLKMLEQLFDENCEEDDIGKDEECFLENEEYISECIYVGPIQGLELLTGRGITDENALKCVMFLKMGDCFVERLGERCSPEAAKVAEDQFADMPEEIAEACKAANDVQGFDVQLFNKKK